MRAQIWENSCLFAALKAPLLGEQGRKLLLCSTKFTKKNPSIEGQIPYTVFQQGNFDVEAQYGFGAVFILIR